MNRLGPLCQPSRQSVPHVRGDEPVQAKGPPREEMEVRFNLMAFRYERGSVLLTSNLPVPPHMRG